MAPAIAVGQERIGLAQDQLTPAVEHVHTMQDGRAFGISEPNPGDAVDRSNTGFRSNAVRVVDQTGGSMEATRVTYSF